DAAGRARGFGAAPEDGQGLGIVPIAEDAFEQVEIGAGGKGIEEALGGDGGAVLHSGGSEDFGGPGDGGGEVNEGAAEMGTLAEPFGGGRPGSASAIDDGMNGGPFGRIEEDVGIGGAVASGAHEGVEFGGDGGMGFEILPVRAAEDV